MFNSQDKTHVSSPSRRLSTRSCSATHVSPTHPHVTHLGLAALRGAAASVRDPSSVLAPAPHPSGLLGSPRPHPSSSGRRSLLPAPAGTGDCPGFLLRSSSSFFGGYNHLCVPWDTQAQWALGRRAPSGRLAGPRGRTPGGRGPLVAGWTLLAPRAALGRAALHSPLPLLLRQLLLFHVVPLRILFDLFLLSLFIISSPLSWIF